MRARGFDKVGRGERTLATSRTRSGKRVAGITRGQIGNFCTDAACISNKALVRISWVRGLLLTVSREFWHQPPDGGRPGTACGAARAYCWEAGTMILFDTLTLICGSDRKGQAGWFHQIP